MMKKYVCVLKMVEAESGLSKDDILAISNMLASADNGYIPLDLESKNGNTCALGFIDASVYESLDYKKSKLMEILGPVLDDMNKENTSCEYELPNGYIVYMDYNI